MANTTIRGIGYRTLLALALAGLTSAGCSTHIPSPAADVDQQGLGAMLGNLRLRAVAQVDVIGQQPHFLTEVTIANTGDSKTEIALSANALGVELWKVRRPVAQDEMAWSSDSIDLTFLPRRIYQSYMVWYPLEPGGTIQPAQLRFEKPVGALLGDTIPHGKYRVVARVRLIEMPEIGLEAGTVDLE